MSTKAYSIFSNLKYIIKIGLVKRKAHIIMLTILLALFDVYISLYHNIVIKIVFDAFSKDSKLFVVCAILAGIFAVAIICRCLKYYLSSKFDISLTEITNLFIENRILKAMTMNYEFMEKQEVLDIMDRAEDATLGGNNAVEVTLSSFANIFTYITIIFTTIFLFMKVGYIIPFTILITSVFHFIIINKIKKMDKRNVWDKMAPINRKQGYLERVSSQFSHGKEIRLFSLENWISTKLSNVHSEIIDKQKQSQKYWLIASVSDLIIIVFQQLAIYAVLISLYSKGKISIGDFAMYIGLSLTIYNSFSGILKSVADIKNSSRLMNDYRRFIELSTNIENGTEDRRACLQVEDFEICFENVSFKYPGSDKFVLKNINFSIHSGEHIALVGSNGAGKSTFIKLLCGLYAPTQGSIYFNGIDIQTINKSAYFKLFSPVFQNTNVFAASVEDNIALEEVENIDVKKVEQCLSKTNLLDKINKLPGGIQTELLKVFSDSGVELSGGEYQKLALTRALYKDGSIFILDEPTAALDAIAESELYQSLDSMLRDKTIVFISHRLSSTRFCDKIVFLEQGEIVEEGSHMQLLGQCGKYADMYKKQACYYRDERMQD